MSTKPGLAACRKSNLGPTSRFSAPLVMHLEAFSTLIHVSLARCPSIDVEQYFKVPFALLSLDGRIMRCLCVAATKFWISLFVSWHLVFAWFVSSLVCDAEEAAFWRPICTYCTLVFFWGRYFSRNAMTSWCSQFFCDGVRTHISLGSGQACTKLRTHVCYCWWKLCMLCTQSSLWFSVRLEHETSAKRYYFL